MTDDIDAYISGFPTDVRPILEKIRATILKAAPDAEESISYGIPTYKRNGKYLIYFAGFKQHVSIYPILFKCPGFEDELAPYRSGKGTAKFQLNKPIPFALIAKIVAFMAQENARRNAEKTKSKRSKT